jgi:hypothetical protein
MEPSGSKLPKLLAVVVVNFEEVEATNKVETSPEGKAGLDLSQGHPQMPVDGVEVQSTPRKTAQHPKRTAISVERQDTTAKCADQRTKTPSSSQVRDEEADLSQ